MHAGRAKPSCPKNGQDSTSRELAPSVIVGAKRLLRIVFSEILAVGVDVVGIDRFASATFPGFLFSRVRLLNRGTPLAARLSLVVPGLLAAHDELLAHSSDIRTNAL